MNRQTELIIQSLWTNGIRPYLISGLQLGLICLWFPAILYAIGFRHIPDEKFALSIFLICVSVVVSILLTKLILWMWGGLKEYAKDWWWNVTRPAREQYEKEQREAREKEEAEAQAKKAEARKRREAKRRLQLARERRQRERAEGVGSTVVAPANVTTFDESTDFLPNIKPPKPKKKKVKKKAKKKVMKIAEAPVGNRLDRIDTV